jgi:hypothetical protein
MRATVKKVKMPPMSTGNRAALLAASALCAVALGCSSTPNGVATGLGGGSDGGGLLGAGGTVDAGGSFDIGGQAGENSPTTRKTITLGGPPNNQVDILFVEQSWSGDPESQARLDAQIPSFLSVLKASATPLDLHIALVTADMGAPGDLAGMTGFCTAAGDDGAFRSAPTGNCVTTTLAAGATFLADDGRGTTNFTGSTADVLQCIFPVGNTGCGIPQPLAAMAHALGADNLQNGVPTPPATNTGFLRPDAALAVIILANQDDCSAPAGTALFSLDGSEQNLANPLGPLGTYRCNHWGHLCQDPASGATLMPPLTPPADAQGTAAAPTLDLENCKDNDQGTGLLTPVSQFISAMNALKPDAGGQILIAAIVAPASPYTVRWMPETDGEDTQPGELWPEVEHSCGVPGADGLNPEVTMDSEGNFGDPGVRITQFANNFAESVVASICDPSYAASVQAIATKITALPPGQNCLEGQIQRDDYGQPTCTVTATIANASGATLAVPYPNCIESANIIPCWTMGSGGGACDGLSLAVKDLPGQPSETVTATCSLCKPGVAAPGC